MSDESFTNREPCPICGETACVCEKPLPKMGVPPKRLLPQSGKGRGKGRGKEAQLEPPPGAMEFVTEVEDNFEKEYVPYSPLQRLARPVSSTSTDASQAKDGGKSKDKKGKGKDKQVKIDDGEDNDISYREYSPLKKLDVAGPSSPEEENQVKLSASKTEARRRRLLLSSEHEPDFEDYEDPVRPEKKYSEDSDTES